MNNNYPPVIVIGLNSCSLSLIRSLGRRGIRVVGLYDDIYEKYFLESKYCSVKIKISSVHNESLIDFLINDLASKLKEPAVLFCASDMTVLTVSKHEDQLKPCFKFVLPSYKVTNNLISKRGLHDFAIKNDFLVPNTFFTNSNQEIEEIADKVSYPCIIKPEFRDRNWNDNVPEKVLYAESKKHLFGLINRYKIQERPLIIQEWIDGDDTEVYFCLAYISRNQKPLALCVGKKLRQHPHLTGSTSIAETVWLPEIADESLRMLMTAGIIGLCSVEFKKSRKDGRYFLTEPTIGRPDTQEGICLSAGIDMPYIAYLDAISKQVEVLEKYEVGMKWINEPLAFYSFQELMRQERNLKKIRTLYKGPRDYSLWRYDDPRPAITFYKGKLEKGLRKLSKRISGRKKFRFVRESKKIF